MSWNVIIAGHDKGVVKGHINRNERMPAYLKAAICAAIDGIPDEQPFVVDSAGHMDTSGGNAKFSVRTQGTIIT